MWWTRMERQLYIENQCKWRNDARFRRRRRVWSVWSVWGIWSGASEASEATRIKLKISNFSGGIAPRHPISDELKPTTSLPSRTVVYGRPEQYGGEADISCLWAPGAVWHHCGVLQGQNKKKAEVWVKVDVERAGWEISVQKRSGQACRLFFSSEANEANDANEVNEVNSPKWSSGAIEAPEAIVFASVAFGLSAP